MGTFSHVARCSELTRADILAALVSPDSTYELCARLSFVSRSGESAEAVLRVFSLLASGSAEWIRGELRVTLEASGTHSIVTAFERREDGRFAELFPPLRFALALTELRFLVDTHPEALGGLEMWEAPRGLELGAPQQPGHQPSVVPRSRAASSGVRPATPQPGHERPSSSPTRRETKKVQVPHEALRKLKDG